MCLQKKEKRERERQRQTDRDRKKKMKKPPLDSKVGVTAVRVLLIGRNVCVSFLPPRVIRLHSTRSSLQTERDGAMIS